MESAEPVRPPRLTSREGSREEPGSRARRVYGGGAPRNFVDLSPRCHGTDDSKEGRTNERFELYLGAWNSWNWKRIVRRSVISIGILVGVATSGSRPGGAGQSARYETGGGGGSIGGALFAGSRIWRTFRRKASRVKGLSNNAVPGLEIPCGPRASSA